MPGVHVAASGVEALLQLSIAESTREDSSFSAQTEKRAVHDARAHSKVLPIRSHHKGPGVAPTRRCRTQGWV